MATFGRRALAALLAMPALARPGAAQTGAGPSGAGQEEWPSRPILLLVGFPPGGPNDLVARVLAARLGEALGKPVIVENRPGANSNIAAAAVARAAPDGHTFLYNSSSIALSAAFSRTLTYDALRDLTPINGTATLPLVTVVEAGGPMRDAAEWAAAIRRRPGQLNYGSPGVGNLAHVGMAMILKNNGLDATHVPFRGSSEALTALIGGSIQFQLDSVNSPLGQIRAGRVRPLFVTSRQRSELLPEVPTARECGFGDMDVSGWQGIMGPAGLPSAIVARLGAEIGRAMASAPMRAALVAQGAYAIATTPPGYAAFLADEIARFKALADELAIRLD